MSDTASSFSRARYLPVLVQGLALALGAFAYRGLLSGTTEVAASSAFERWFFAPGLESALFPTGLALWMLVRRRARLRALPDRGAPVLASSLVAAGILLFAWARMAGAPGLLPLSLTANLLGFAAAAKGRAGCRAALLPALVLALGTPLPGPLRHEIAWELQGWSARGASWLLEAAGAEIALHGVVIHRGEHAFTVIESCSGMRGIEILTLVALAIRELFTASGWRSWLVVAAAPCLGYALNALRIAAVVALTGSADATEGWDHTPQGVAVLAAGTALLYLVAHAFAGAERARAPGAERRPAEGARGSRATPAALRAGALIVVALLAALSCASLPLARAPALPGIELPLERAGWVGEDLPLDRFFVGQFLPGQVLHRRYQMQMTNRPPRIVEILVGYEDAANRGSRLFSPKLLLVDHEWSLVASDPVRLWLLGLDARLTVTGRDSELALGYLWRLRDDGLWRETWRAVWELDAGPLRRERPRAVVRLVTPLANDDAVARGRAKRTLDRFVADFLDELSRL